MSVSRIALAFVLALGTTTLAQARVWFSDVPSTARPGKTVRLLYRLDRIASLHGVALAVDGEGFRRFQRGRHAGTPGLRFVDLRLPRRGAEVHVIAFARQGGRSFLSRVRTIRLLRGNPSRPRPVARQRFEVTIENLGAAGPLAPGTYAVHRGPNAVFRTNRVASAGLEQMAEDGDPSALVAELQSNRRVIEAAAFNTPAGQTTPGPALPGQVYRFEFTARAAERPRLSFATMFAQTNDAFVGPIRSIALFDRAGRALPARTIDLLAFEAGTEANQAFGLGPDQAPRQPRPNTGAAEGVVRPFSDATRALPLADKIVKVTVREIRGGALRIGFENVSAASGAILSPITPVFHALHDGGFEMFRIGQPAFNNGLEQLAEDGDPSGLVAAATAQGARAAAAGNGPIMPGETVSFNVQPSPSQRWLSVATMIARTNDAFIAAEGIDLLDSNGNRKSPRRVAAELAAALHVYDAGTEANEVPGVGPNTAPLQAGPNTGPADPNPLVRRYDDSTNDLSGSSAGGFAALSVNDLGNGSYELVLRNTSAQTTYPGQLTPVVYYIHDGNAPLFEIGQPASHGLEALAEDGATDALLAALRRQRGVGHVGVAQPDAQGNFRFTVQTDATYRFVQIATMIVPSNDTFLAVGPTGLETFTATGSQRSLRVIRSQARQELTAWDAGTERNQSGAAGPDQPPASHGTGADEGIGLVRVYDDPVWSLPAIERAVRVTIRPIR